MNRHWPYKKFIQQFQSETEIMAYLEYYLGSVNKSS